MKPEYKDAKGNLIKQGFYLDENSYTIFLKETIRGWRGECLEGYVHERIEEEKDYCFANCSEKVFVQSLMSHLLGAVTYVPKVIRYLKPEDTNKLNPISYSKLVDELKIQKMKIYWLDEKQKEDYSKKPIQRHGKRRGRPKKSVALTSSSS